MRGNFDFKAFLTGFLSVCSVFLLSMSLLTSCNQLKDSTQSNTTNNTVNTTISGNDIL